MNMHFNKYVKYFQETYIFKKFIKVNSRLPEMMNLMLGHVSYLVNWMAGNSERTIFLNIII